MRLVELFVSHFTANWLQPCVDALYSMVHAPPSNLLNMGAGADVSSSLSSFSLGTGTQSVGLYKRVHTYLFEGVPALKRVKGGQGAPMQKSSRVRHIGSSWRNSSADIREY